MLLLGTISVYYSCDREDGPQTRISAVVDPQDLTSDEAGRSGLQIAGVETRISRTQLCFGDIDVALHDCIDVD
jgi:hypothetical protein